MNSISPGVFYCLQRRGYHAIFFCGGSRNFHKFIDLFDSVFVLEVDLKTCIRRIDERVALDPTD